MSRRNGADEAILSRNERQIVRNGDTQKALVQADRDLCAALHAEEDATQRVRAAAPRICALHKCLETHCAHLRHENASISGVKLTVVA